MSVLELKYGQLSTMPVSLTEGQFLVAVDAQKAFVDLNSKRIPLGDVVTGMTAAQITGQSAANIVPTKLYLSSDTKTLYWYTPADTSVEPVVPAKWEVVGNAVEKAEKDGAGNVITATYETKEDATTKYNTLVAQIAAINSFEVQLVESKAALDALAPGEPNVIYFVPGDAISTNPDNQIYDEYMWVITTPADPEADPPVAAVGRFEKIGTTETDLTNYYTKSEFNAIIGTMDPTAQGFVTVGGRLTEIEAKIGDMDASTTSGFNTIEQRLDSAEGRLTTAESDIDELEGKFGAYAATTATGFKTVEQRFSDDESAIAEINGKLGNMAASTSTGFETVEQRLTALETDTTDATAITELQAKFGAYAASTDTEFVTVENRFAALEGRVDNEEAATSRLDAELGTLDSTATDYVPVATRLSTNESDIDTLEAVIGTLDPTATGYQTVAQRLATAESDIDTAEGDIDTLEAVIGSLDPTATGYQTVAQRLATNESDIDEIEAKIGNMAASTTQGFHTIEERLSAEESATSRLDAELGTLDSTATDYVPVATRLSTAESDIDTAQADITEIQAQIGASYPASTSTGFKSIDTRLTEIASAVGNINKFDIKVVQQLPASHLGESYVIYFVPIAQGQDDNGGKTKYAEYMWFKNGQKKTIDDPDNPGQTIEVDDGYFEEIGITEADLTEYYTSSQVDAKLGTMDSTYIGQKGTVADRLDEIEAKFGAYASSTASGFATVEARFTSAEGRLSTAETDINTLEAIIGSLDPTDTGYVDLATRVSTAESDIDTAESDINTLESIIGSLDPTATGYVDLATRMSGAEGNIDTLEAVIGTLDPTATDYQTVAQRLTTNEGDIDTLEAVIGTLDPTVSGYQTIDARLSAIEGGAVTQSEDLDNAEKPILVSGDQDHSTVEYVSNVTVNATAGSVTANSIVLGGATVTYDSNTDALVINF